MTTWLAEHRRLATSLAALLGVLLIAWAYFVDGSWGQGLLVNVGTALLLLAPLFYLNRALEEKVQQLSRQLAVAGRAYAEGEALISDPVERGAYFDELVEWFREMNPEPLTRSQMSDLGRRGVPFRVIALDAMRANPRLLDGDLIRRGVVASESGNEQLYALDAALACWHELPARVREDIIGCIDGHEAFSRYIWDDPARADVALRIRALSSTSTAARRL